MKSHCIGMMSGTSLDGIDLVEVIFEGDPLKYRIIKSATISYSDSWKEKLKDAFDVKGHELVKLSHDYGRFLGEQINDFINQNNIKEIDFIASHGQTIFHNPTEGYTLQIGNGPEISIETNCKTITDFRTQDVALGGQGAPLVPIGDRLLFGNYEYCLNIGGFANSSQETASGRIAYDICPANIVLNHYANQMGMPYDDGGNLARSGSLALELLDELNSLDYYRQAPPKSLGYEYVTEHIFPLIDKHALPVESILRTYVEHLAGQIGLCLDKKESSCLVTGGGALNDFMIERITDLAEADIVIPDRVLIDYKEALIFALLGHLRFYGKINCLSSVTGASRDHSSGVIHQIN